MTELLPSLRCQEKGTSEPQRKEPWMQEATIFKAFDSQRPLLQTEPEARIRHREEQSVLRAISTIHGVPRPGGAHLPSRPPCGGTLGGQCYDRAPWLQPRIKKRNHEISASGLSYMTNEMFFARSVLFRRERLAISNFPRNLGRRRTRMKIHFLLNTREEHA